MAYRELSITIDITDDPMYSVPLMLAGTVRDFKFSCSSALDAQAYIRQGKYKSEPLSLHLSKNLLMSEDQLSFSNLDIVLKEDDIWQIVVEGAHVGDSLDIILKIET